MPARPSTVSLPRTLIVIAASSTLLAGCAFGRAAATGGITTSQPTAASSLPVTGSSALIVPRTGDQAERHAYGPGARRMDAPTDQQTSDGGRAVHPRRARS